MFSKKLSKTGWPLVGAAALISTLLSGNVAAKEVTVAIHVSTQGLDLSQASDARTFYLRMKDAAW
ncbi:UrcA family protein, partial [Shewanella algae]|uniref:UrcA family protein n=1 Tax=Shewanella algae TaxID=38313 RepID=UPI00313D1DB9